MKIRTTLCLVLLHLFFYKIGANNLSKDSLIQIVNKSSTHDTTKVKTFIRLAWELKYENNILAKKYCLQGLTLAKKLKRKKDSADALKLNGILADEAGEPKESISNYLEAIVFYKELKDTLGVAKCEYNIGVLYLALKQPSEAKRYFLTCIKDFERQKFAPGIQITIQNLGICHYDKQNYDSALYFFEKSIKLGERTGSIDPNTVGNIGNCYYYKNDLVKAKQYLSKACLMFKEAGETSTTFYHYKSILAGILIDFNDYKNGLAMYEECKSAYEKAGLYFTRENANLLSSMSRDYARSGNLKMALDNANEALHIKDSIYSSNFATAMSEMKEKYDAEKNNLQINNLNNEAKLKDAEIENQSKQKIGLIAGLSLMLGFSFILYKNVVNKKKANTIIGRQKAIVDEKNKEIIDSITYAKRLQTAILPSPATVNKYLPDSFLIYVPKDIIAGDFYWFDETDEKIFLAVADSTGHGVPGAMVSVVCSNALHRTLHEFNIHNTGSMLDKTRELVLETFSKSGEHVKDGMDISLISIDKKMQGKEFILNWSGANNQLIYIKNGELKTIKAHKQPIGQTEFPTAFPTHELILTQGDCFYLFTDGFADQFGGEKGKKLKSSNLMQLLYDNRNLPIDDYKSTLTQAFYDWKGNYEQVDDVCIIGVRL